MIKNLMLGLPLHIKNVQGARKKKVKTFTQGGWKMDNRDFKALLDVLERIAVALEKIANSKPVEVKGEETIVLGGNS